MNLTLKNFIFKHLFILQLIVWQMISLFLTFYLISFFCKRLLMETVTNVRDFILRILVFSKCNYHFQRIYLTHCNFSPEIQEMFKNNKIKSSSLDLYLPSCQFIDVVRSRNSGCMIFKTCNKMPLFHLLSWSNDLYIAKYK